MPRRRGAYHFVLFTTEWKPMGGHNGQKDGKLKLMAAKPWSNRPSQFSFSKNRPRVAILASF
jgi:hypothetical protein